MIWCLVLAVPTLKNDGWLGNGKDDILKSLELDWITQNGSLEKSGLFSISNFQTWLDDIPFFWKWKIIQSCLKVWNHQPDHIITFYHIPVFFCHTWEVTPTLPCGFSERHIESTWIWWTNSYLSTGSQAGSTSIPMGENNHRVLPQVGSW